jgi:hypothetical protein
MFDIVRTRTTYAGLSTSGLFNLIRLTSILVEACREFPAALPIRTSIIFIFYLSVSTSDWLEGFRCDTNI